MSLYPASRPTAISAFPAKALNPPVTWSGCFSGVMLFEETVPLAENDVFFVVTFAQYVVPVVRPVTVALVLLVFVQYVVGLDVVP